MDRDCLGHLPVVLAVARRGGFASAAAELGMSPSAVSHAVRTVEDRLGVPLFARTTRSVSLTEAGRVLVDGAGPALDEIGERLGAIRGAAGAPAGFLRISAGSVTLPIVLTEVIAETRARAPGVRVEVRVDNALTDIVAEGFDAGVRLGEMIAEDMVAVRLTPPFCTAIVAAPAYLADAGVPERIADLSAHACIGYRLRSGGGFYRWELFEENRDVQVSVGGGPVTDDPVAARDFALAGLGLLYAFRPLVEPDLAAGRLVEVMPDSAIEEPGFFLYFPRRAAMAPKLRAFIDAARAVAHRRREGAHA